MIFLIASRVISNGAAKVATFSKPPKFFSIFSFLKELAVSLQKVSQTPFSETGCKDTHFFFTSKSFFNISRHNDPYLSLSNSRQTLFLAA